MNGKFDMSDLGKLTYYLGIEVEQGPGYIELKQTGYAKNILEKVEMAECNQTKFPMDPKNCIRKDEEGVAVDTTDFKSIIGVHGCKYSSLSSHLIEEVVSSGNR